jgi:hypothetical protein
MAKYSDSGKIKLVGLDVFVFQPGKVPELSGDFGPCELKSISNRGTKVWPNEKTPPQLTDVHCCRFRAKGDMSANDITRILGAIESQGYDWVHIEKLLEFDGKPGFTLASGE